MISGSLSGLKGEELPRYQMKANASLDCSEEPKTSF